MTKKEKALIEERRIFMEALANRVERIENQQKWIEWEATLLRKGWTRGGGRNQWFPPKNIAKVYDFETGYRRLDAVDIHKSVLFWNKKY